jgi:hypothetical protein
LRGVSRTTLVGQYIVTDAPAYSIRERVVVFRPATIDTATKRAATKRAGYN